MCNILKVGVYQSEVKYDAPTYEPYPDLKDLKYTYQGGKDQQVIFVVDQLHYYEGLAFCPSYCSYPNDERTGSIWHSAEENAR